MIIHYIHRVGALPMSRSLTYSMILLLLALASVNLSAEDEIASSAESKSSVNADNLPATKDDEATLVIRSLPDLMILLNRANQTFSYRSLFTYEANGYITTYRLHHRIKDKKIYQQLFFLDGPPREVIRQQSLSSCQLGDAPIGVWSIAQPGASLSSYDFKVKGVERVAGRTAIIFDITPKDDYRYGYRYSVDKSTGLILKMITYDEEKIIERLQTVSLELVSEEEFLQEKATASYIWRVPEVEPCQTEQYQAGWKVDWLPKNFELVGTRLTAQGEQVLMYADGLVLLSVFITNSVSSPLNKITARHGATVMVVAPIVSKSDRSIAVVGEVPVITARRIARSVKSIE